MAISKNLQTVIEDLLLNADVSTELVNILQNASNKASGLAWRPPVRVVDDISTTFPTTPPLTVDGVTLSNYDRILFTNLTDPDDNNRVYQVVGVTAPNLEFILEIDENPGDGSPSEGDTLAVQDGNLYGETIRVFNGITWVNLLVSVGNTIYLRLDGTNLMSGNIRWLTDGGGTIGLSAGNRPDKAFIKSDVSIGSAIADANSILALKKDQVTPTRIAVENANAAGRSSVHLTADGSTLLEISQYGSGSAPSGGMNSGTALLRTNSVGGIGIAATNVAGYIKLLAGGDGAINEKLRIASSAVTLFNGANLLWATDAGGDVGASGANRPNNLFLANNATVGNNVLVGAEVIVQSALRVGDDYIRMSSGAGNLTLSGGDLLTDGGVIVLEGQASAFPNSIRFDTDGLARIRLDEAGDLLWVADGVGNIGESAGSRPNRMYLLASLAVGSSVQTLSLDGFGYFGNKATVSSYLGSIGTGVNEAQLGFSRAGGADKAYLRNSGTNNDVFLTVYTGGSPTDKFKFGANGDLTLMELSGGDLLWNTDGGGDIGQSGASRPNHIYAAGNLDVGGDAVIGGNLTVNGTTTVINTTVVEIEDTNLVINNGGNDASAEGAGITVERTSTHGSLVFDSTLPSKWKLGLLGSESQVITSALLDELVDDRVALLIQNGTGLTWTYVDALNTLTGNVSLAPFSTTDLAEGTNLYFTDERAQDAVGSILTNSASVTWSYNDPAGTIMATVVAGAVDHGGLAGLADDDHLQYALLAGRTTGQTLNGGIGAGEHLFLSSTTHGTKGEVRSLDTVRIVGASKHLLWDTDASGNIGDVAANRPNNIHVAGRLQFGTGDLSTNRSFIKKDSSGNNRMTIATDVLRFFRSDDTTYMASLAFSGGRNYFTITDGDILFDADGAGSIGSRDGGSTMERPDKVFVKTFVETPQLFSTTGSSLAIEARATRINFKVAGVTLVQVESSGDLFWTADGVGNIGGSSANRPNNAYIKNSVLIDGTGAGGIGVGGLVDSTNLINFRRDIDGLTRGLLRNTHAGASAIARWTVAAGAGDLNMFAASIAGGAVAGITADATFTGGLSLGILGTNPLTINTNSTTRFKVNAAGDVNLYGPHALPVIVKSDVSNANGLRLSMNSGTDVAQIINGYNAALELGTNALVRVTIAANGDVTVAQNLVVTGDLTVNGTTTTINTANLEVEDQNIVVNNSGNDVSAQGAGLTVERTGTFGSLVYDSALTSKWKAGSLGTEAEILTAANIAANAFVDGGNSFGQTAELGTNDAFDLILKTNNATRMSISSAGVANMSFQYAAISATPTAAIKLRMGVGGTDGDFSGIKLESTHVVTANSARYFIGMDLGAPDIRISTGVTNSGYFIGSRSYGLRDKAADLGGLTDLSGIDIASGHYSTAGATISTTNAYGVNIKPYQEIGTITNFYGVRVASPNTGGTVTNNWAFYQDATAMRNYFAGQTLQGNPATGTGTGAPTARLHVRSDNSTGAILAIGDGVQANINALAYGTSNSFSGYRAQGTAASPTAVASQSLTNLQGFGYDGSAFALGGYVSVQAGTTWSGSDHETYILFGGTPSGSTTPGTILQIRGNGQVRGVDGLAATPTYSFINSTSAGLYSQGSGSFAASVAGVAAQEWGTGGIDIRGSLALPFIVKSSVSDSTGLKLYIDTGLARIVNESIGDTLQLGTNNLNRLQIDAAGSVRMMNASGANLLWDTDGGGDIGASGANRPDRIYARTSIHVGAFTITGSEFSYLDDAEGLTTVALADNQASAADVATWAHASFSAIHMTYSLSRGAGIRETGVIMISTDGTTATVSREGAPVGSNGITFTADVSGANVRLRYTSTSTGTGATMKYKLLKWLA